MRLAQGQKLRLDLGFYPTADQARYQAKTVADSSEIQVEQAEHCQVKSPRVKNHYPVPHPEVL